MQGQHHTWAHLQVLKLVEACASGPRIPDEALCLWWAKEHGEPGAPLFRVMTRNQLRLLAERHDHLIFRPVDSSCWTVCTADQS